MDDLKLVKNCQDIDMKYFWKLYDKYIDSIYKFIYLKTSNKEVAEDITSDVFYKALNSIEKFDVKEGSSFKAWIYTIAWNKVKDHYKTNKVDVSMEEYMDVWKNEDIWTQIDDKEKVQEVFDFLQTLKDEHKEVIVLRIWNDLNYNEISEITWKSVDNCKKIVSRGLKTISANFVLVLIFIILL